MLKSFSYPRSNSLRSISLDLVSILLVESDSGLRECRRLRFSSLKQPVLAVSGSTDVVGLPLRSNCRLAAIGIGLSEQNAARIAMYVRRTWPGANILLLGRPSGLFDDPLYNDSVLSSGNPAGILKAASQLLNG